jgi:hypothetical protein
MYLSAEALDALTDPDNLEPLYTQEFIRWFGRPLPLPPDADDVEAMLEDQARVRELLAEFGR